MELTAEKIIAFWNNFSENYIKKNDWKNQWNSSSYAWTNFILGEKNTSNKNSPLGDYFKSEFKETEYCKEDSLIDLTIANKMKFSGISSLHKIENERNIKDFSDEYYPSSLLIALEHENQVEMCWEEMFKLSYIRSKFKVLITYNYDQEENENHNYVIEILENNFKKVIELSRKELTDNSTYILIVGQLTIDSNLIWYYKIFENP